MIGWGAGWIGICGLMMVVMMVMMIPMMRGHGHSGHGGHGSPGWTDDPERTLADRLARGEIDSEEYHRLLDTLRETDHSPRAAS